ncbi:MAG TPA: hypothetical protein VF128_02640 [Gemmatimonadaceae bacterium]
MPRTATHKNLEFLDAVSDEVSPALESVDFAGLLDQLVAWTQGQKPPLERRTNASRTTISYTIPENDVVVWRVAPRMKDGAKVEVLPRDSALLPVRARQAIAKLLEVLSPGVDLDPDRRFMIPMHNLAEPRVMKQFLSILDVATRAARKLKRAA